MIYFLRCEVTGLVKIGFSTDERTLMRRVSDLRVGASTPLRFMAVVSGTIDDERDYHLVQRALHSHGEWFRIPLEDLPPDELGLADVLNSKGTPKKFGDRTCTKCGKEFLVRKGMSRWKPRTRIQSKGKRKPSGNSNQTFWCNGCVDERNARVSKPVLLGAQNGLPGALIKKYLSQGMSDSEAVAAARLDKDFMLGWKQCRALGINSGRITSLLNSGLSFDEVAAAGPGKRGRPKGSKNAVTKSTAPRSARRGPLAAWFSSTGATLRQLAEASGVARDTLHESLRGAPLGASAAARLSAVTGICADDFRRSCDGDGAQILLTPGGASKQGACESFRGVA